MKQIIIFTIVFITSMASSTISACQFKRTPEQGEIVELQGILDGIPQPCYDPTYEHCPECEIPVINAGGVTYIINEQETNWSMYILNNHIMILDKIEASGVVSKDEKYHYIDLISLNKMTQAIDNTTPTLRPDLQQPVFNTLGLPVDETYRGIVIQNGQKFLR